MPWDIPAGVLVQGGIAAYNQRAKILEVSSKIAFFFTKGVLRIVVFGAGGVGKSTLGGFLAVGNPNTVRPVAYKPSREIERTSLRGGFVGGLVIAPGQEDLYPEDWQQLFDYLSDGKTRVVIKVVARGYHSFEKLRYQDLKLYAPGMSKEQFLQVYVQEGQKREDELITTIEPYLLAARRSIRMITLVTKQDLWWNKWIDVQRHYEEGPYGNVIKNVQERRTHSRRGFIHSYIPISLVIDNFRDGQEEILVPTTQGYDQTIQQAWQETLIESVRDFARR